MNVHIESTRFCGEQALKHYPCLSEFGAKLVKDEYDVDCVITINTLDDIMSLIKKTGCPIILDENGDIEIYDNYRE